MNILWAIIALAGLGIVAALVGLILNKMGSGDIAEDYSSSGDPTIGGCCGMHMTCERDSLLSAVSPSIVYYDDEELDRYRGVTSSDYTSTAVDEFREVLITLHPDEVAGWVRSLQLREIEIPEELLPEIFLIVGEVRAYHMEHGPEA